MASTTTASSSPPASPQQDQRDSIILTPSRKVKALLAQFDDSDPDRSTARENAKRELTKVGRGRADSGEGKTQSKSPRDLKPGRGIAEDEVFSRKPRGRLAAGMQSASTDDHFEPSGGDSGASAFRRIKDQIARLSKPTSAPQDTSFGESSGDEQQNNVPRRKLVRNHHTPAGDHFSGQGSRSPSPLFFPSPSAARSTGKSHSKRTSSNASGSENIPGDTAQRGGSKFLALVNKHREQRLAREAADEAKRAERLEQLKKVGSQGSSNVGAVPLDDLSDESDLSDGIMGKRLTQQARPTRKASKKALQEMNRETQRMSRSMQLAHQARTKKKITKESLLARFNFIAPQSEIRRPAKIGHTSNTASSNPASDVDGAREQSTPPTSPLPLQEDKQLAKGEPIADELVGNLVDDKELPTMEELLIPQSAALDKGKTKAASVDEPTDLPEQPIKNLTNPPARLIRVKWSKQDAVLARGADSDSDLEIVTSNSKFRKFNAFESLPQRRSGETNSHLVLRSLAHLQTRTTDDKHSQINSAQMEAHLRRAARVQAQKEREEKLEELRSKGIFIQTAEERQKEQQEVEDLVERARVEGAEIQRKEKEMAKKDGTFVKDQLDDEESDDEGDADFEDGNEDIDDQMSGSGEEIDDGIDEEAGLETKVDSGKDHEAEAQEIDMVDKEAHEAKSDDSSEISQAEDDDGDEFKKEDQPSRLPGRNRRHVIDSDDEDEEVADGQHHSSPQYAKTPQSILRSARKIIPGLQMSDDLPIGLTQAFAATMADSDTEDEGVVIEEQDSLALTRDLPSPNFNGTPSLNRLDSIDIVTDSQPPIETQPLDLDLSITQIQAVPQSPEGMPSTQFSFMPTQDVGYVMSPFKENRFDTPLQAPHSTIDTVILPQEEMSPTLQRKGRLRRGRANTNTSDEAIDSEDRARGLGLDRSAFAVMQRAARMVEQQDVFDKSKSNAKDVVDEAAEESEDEYAGLGGVSDDDEGEEDEADRQIIDHDEALGQGDESKLAGFYADKERKQDEAAVSKLLKDITTGALRRKRGGADDIDLSDEEDATARRREAKRREFARMRRELLKDEAVGKIAEDKKKQAFLKSIEDHDENDDDDAVFHEDQEMEEDTQSQTLPAEEVNTHTEPSIVSAQPHRKRPLEPSASDITNRPPPTLRRTSKPSAPTLRKPSTIAEIRSHVSFLIEDPNSQTTHPDPDSSSDADPNEPEAYVNLDRHLQGLDAENEDAHDPGLANFIVDDEADDEIAERRPAFKKPHLPPARAPARERRTKANVVDRLTLLRQSSSSSSASVPGVNAGSKLAFFTTEKSSASALFRPPTLLRRVTGNLNSNSSFDSSSESGSGSRNTSATGVRTTERGAVEQEKEMVRKAAGGRRSAINFYAGERGRAVGRVKEGRVEKKRVVGKAGKEKGKGGFLGGLFGRDSWE